MSPGLDPGPGKNTFSSFAIKDVGSDGEESSCNVGDPGLISGSRRFPWRREWLPTPVGRVGKTRDRFKKIRDTKGTFYAKMGTIKDRNSTDLTEAEDRRGGKNTEELYKKDLNDPDNHDGVITHIHLEPDILECEVKWALGSITMNKASGGDGIPVELFQILKDDAVKVLHSICQQIWKAQQWPQDWKMSVFIPMPKKGNAKECSNYCTIARISHSRKVMLKILQARLQ